MKFSGKKTIVAAALCGFLAGNFASATTVNAGGLLGGLGSILKAGGIFWVVDQYGEELNTFINKLTSKYAVSEEYSTKVVPILAVGTKGYVGAAQISGPKSMVDQCQAALALEGDFLNRAFRIQALIPVDSKDPSKCQRVQGVGVSAKIDVAI